MKRHVLILLMILLSSCGKWDMEYAVFVVPAGENKCNSRVKVALNKHQISGRFRTNPTWMMPYLDCINKIVGIAEGSHVDCPWLPDGIFDGNSCQIGYTCDNYTGMVFYQYVWRDGNNYWQPVDTAYNHVWHEFDIYRNGNEWWMWLDHSLYRMEAGHKCFWAYAVFCFIGGDKSKTIDHDWIVEMEIY